MLNRTLKCLGVFITSVVATILANQQEGKIQLITNSKIALEPLSTCLSSSDICGDNITHYYISYSFKNGTSKSALLNKVDFIIFVAVSDVLQIDSYDSCVPLTQMQSVNFSISEYDPPVCPTTVALMTTAGPTTEVTTRAITTPQITTHDTTDETNLKTTPGSATQYPRTPTTSSLHTTAQLPTTFLPPPAPLSGGVIAGIVIGSTAVVLLTVGLVIWIIRCTDCRTVYYDLRKPKKTHQTTGF